MKKNRFAIVFLVISVIAVCMSVCAFAATATTYKTVITHDKQENKVTLDIYVDSGTAIAGYCNFKYDTSVLSLVDKNGDTVPETIDDFLSDGKTTYLKNIINSYNGADITDVKRGASKLINTEKGYLFFAWAVPSRLPAINASEDKVKVASVDFDVVSSSVPDEDSIIVASKQYTNTVDSWYNGMIVLNEAKKAFIYDGDKTGTEYYSSEFITSGKANPDDDPQDTPDDEPQDTPDDEPQDTPDDEPQDTLDDEPQDTPDDEPQDTPDDEPQDTPDDEPHDTPDDEPQDTPDDEPQDTPDDEPQDNPDDSNCNGTENETVSEATCAKEIDFKIEIIPETESARIKWLHPEDIDIESYTLIICDKDFDVVKKVSGISNISISYTVSDLYGGTDYRIYLMAQDSDSIYTSDVYSFKTDDYESYPPVNSFNVTYDKNGTYLYGLANENVMYGGYVTKVPEVITKDGSVFIGWSKDKVNVIDIYNEKIYTDTVFYPLTASAKPAAKTYIAGYSDGSFKPEGNITRAEAATIISRISNKFSSSTRYCHTFTDCPEGIWYEKAVAFCSSQGYIKGYEDATFRPDGNITRAEFATILVRVFGYDGITGLNVFSDLDGHWAKDYVSVLYSAGIIVPDQNGKFRPNEKLTREDAVSMINRCLETIPDRQSILDELTENGYKFSDVPQHSASFFDIMSAVMK